VAGFGGGGVEGGPGAAHGLGVFPDFLEVRSAVGGLPLPPLAIEALAEFIADEQP
jgi:hypothetical protein